MATIASLLCQVGYARYKRIGCPVTRRLPYPGTNDLVTADDAETAIRAAASARVVLCQLEVPIPATLAALRAAKARGDGSVTTFFSPAPAPPTPGSVPQELWAACDVVLPNAIEARQVCA
jgi:ribokinase